MMRDALRVHVFRVLREPGYVRVVRVDLLTDVSLLPVSVNNADALTDCAKA